MPSSSESNEPAAAPRAPRRRRARWLAGGLLLAATLLLVVVILLPTLLSTATGNRTMLGWLNAQIAGSVEAEHIRIGWMRGPELTNLKLLDPQGELVADVPMIAAPQARPLSLALGGRALGDVNIDVRAIHVRQEPDEPTNVQLALAPTVPREPEPEPDEPTDVQVDPDLSARVQFSAERITYDAPDVDPVELTDLSASLDVTDVQAIELDLSSALRHGDAPGRIAAEVRLSEMFTEAGALQWRQGDVLADMVLENLPVAPVDRLMQMEGRLAALLGPELDAHVRSEGRIDALTAEISASSEYLDVSAQLASDEQSLRSPGGTLSLDVTPDAFARLTAPAANEAAPPAQLLAPFTVELELRELLVPRRGDALVVEEAAIDAGGTVGDVRLNVPELGEVALEQTSMSLSSEAVGEQVEAQLEAMASYADVRESVGASMTVRDALGVGAGRELALEAEALPVALADALGGMEGRLSETLGPTLSVQLNAAQAGEHEFTFDGAIEAERLSGAVEGRWDNESQQGAFRTVSPMSLTLTPAAYEGWVGEMGARLALVEPMTATLDVQVPRLGLREPAADEPDDALAMIDPARTTIGAELNTPRVVLEDPQTGEMLDTEGARLVVPEGSLDEALELLINIRLEDLAGEDGVEPAPQTEPDAPAGAQQQEQQDQEQRVRAAPGTVDSRSRVTNLVGAHGALDPAGAHLTSEVSAVQIPSRAVDLLGQQEGQLAAILGAHTSAEASLDYQRQRGGQVRVDLDTTNVNGRLAATIDPEAVVRLSEDATLSVALTDEVSRVMMRRFNPMLGEIAGAAAPVGLQLYAEGSAVPLDPFEWEGVHMRGQLDVPQVTLRPAGFLSAAFRAMSVLGVLRTADRYEAQLTPADFQVDEGVLSYDNLIIALADDIRLAFAGSVNLVTEALNLDMRFDGAGYPREMRGMTLAVAGTIDDPRLDERRLAEMMARQGVRRGIEELLPGRRDEPAPDEEPEEEPERRSPLDDLLDRVR